MSAPIDPGKTPSCARFGPFTADFRTGELTKYGIRIPLQDQPFLVLRLLIERRGELLTREEARQILWPGNTVSDADGAVPTAVRKIRIALRDSPDRPQYIETLPKRGYRFIGEVAEGDPPALPEQAPLPDPPVVLPPQSRLRLWMLAAPLLPMMAAGIWVARPAPAPRIVEFTRLTSDGQEKVAPVLTDGARVYFNEAGSVYQVPVSGGLPTVVVSGYLAIALSPNHAELVLAAQPVPTGLSDGPLFRYPLPSGPPASLGVTGHSAAWSPRGDAIGYLQGSSVFLLDRSSRSRKLADSTGSTDGLS